MRASNPPHRLRLAGPGGVQDASRPRLDGSGERLGQISTIDDLDPEQAVSRARDALSISVDARLPVRESIERATGVEWPVRPGAMV
ncbi:hypothetical protein WME73_07135 [Sorangium sp. So ce302]|uniref:hypothetical protein n=1 Tax=unclassified Sorangium TaxID=2621164 RepID=UPI003F61A30D